MGTVPIAGDGVDLFRIAITMLALTWVTVVLRVGVRLWRKAFGADDYLMVVGLVLFSVTSSLCLAACFYGSGQRSIGLPPRTLSKGIKLFYVGEYFYAVSAAFTKSSIAVTLLRIAAFQRRYNWPLYAIIGVTWMGAVVFCSGIGAVCQPIETLWFEADGTCNVRLNNNVSYFFSSIEIVTDWGLAIIPAVLLWNVQMKLSVKVSVVFILALASIASCATIVRLRYLAMFNDPAEFLFGTARIAFWSIVEEGIGIVAGSLPALRPLLSLRVRFKTSSNTLGGATTSGRSGRLSNGRRARSHSAVLMDTFHTLAGGDEAENDDADSQKNIVKETQFTVTSHVAVSESELMQGQDLEWGQGLKK